MTTNTAGGVSAIITERVSRIKIADGFETDSGARVYRGRRKIADDLVGTGCTSIIEGADIVEARQGKIPNVKIDQRYALVAYVPILTGEEPNDAAHRALRDLKRVIFAENATFDGQVFLVKYIARDIGPRDDGVAMVLALLEIGVEYVEDLTKP